MLAFYPIRLSARYMPFCIISILIIAWNKSPFWLRWIGVGMMSVASFHMFSLPYDQIHREDYKALCKHLRTNPGQFIHGLEPQRAYYGDGSMRNDTVEPVGWLCWLTNSQASVAERLRQEHLTGYEELEHHRFGLVALSKVRKLREPLRCDR